MGADVPVRAGLMLVIPQWGLWLMFVASVTGSVLLAMQLHATGWRLP